MTDLTATATESPVPASDDDALDAALGDVWDKSADPAPETTDDTETDETAAAAPETGDETADDEDTDQSPEDGGEPTQAIPRPASWSADRDETWSKLPRDAQEYIAHREAELHARISQLGHDAKQAEPFVRLAREHKHLIPQGVSAREATEKLWAAQALLVQDPEAGVQWVAEMYGVDLTRLGQESQSELAQLRRELASMRAEQNRQKAASVVSEQDTVLAVIDKWSAGKPHFAAVEADMIAILPTLEKAGKTHEQVLEEAYAKACRLNDDVWSKLQQERAAQRDREERERRRTADASRNKRLNGGSMSPKGNAPLVSLDDDDSLGALYDRLINA